MEGRPGRRERWRRSLDRVAAVERIATETSAVCRFGSTSIPKTGVVPVCALAYRVRRSNHVGSNAQWTSIPGGSVEQSVRSSRTEAASTALHAVRLPSGYWAAFIDSEREPSDYDVASDTPGPPKAGVMDGGRPRRPRSRDRRGGTDGPPGNGIVDHATRSIRSSSGVMIGTEPIGSSPEASSMRVVRHALMAAVVHGRNDARVGCRTMLVGHGIERSPLRGTLGCWSSIRERKRRSR